METVNFGNVSQKEDPRILATSYMMYKIGKLTVSDLHKYFWQSWTEILSGIQNI